MDLNHLTQFDPHSWEIIEEDHNKVLFGVGGIVMEVSKAGMVYQLWKQQLERLDSGVLDLSEGEPISSSFVSHTLRFRPRDPATGGFRRQGKA